MHTFLVMFVCLCIPQVVASKYLNDEGEMEALTNSDWASLGELQVGVVKFGFYFVCACRRRV